MENKGFTNEELISTLQSLKDEGISGFNQSTVKASVFNKINKAQVKPVLMSFNKYINIFKPVLASLVVLFLGYGGLKMASSISPLSPLYVKPYLNSLCILFLYLWRVLLLFWTCVLIVSCL